MSCCCWNARHGALIVWRRSTGLIAKTTPIVVGSLGQARPSPLYRQALEADLMLCKLLAELHLPAEIPTELERDVVRLRSAGSGRLSDEAPGG